MNCMDPHQAGQPAPPLPGLDTCPVCHRCQPFTAAILAGLGLGQICTCALEQRMLERLVRKQPISQQKAGEQ